MRRGVWFAAGLGAGIYGMVRAQRLAEALTPDGVRDRIAGLRVGARLMAQEFATGSAERESELRERFGLVPTTAGAPQLTPAAPDGPTTGTIAAAPAHAEDPQEGTD